VRAQAGRFPGSIAFVSDRSDDLARPRRPGLQGGALLRKVAVAVVGALHATVDVRDHALSDVVHDTQAG